MSLSKNLLFFLTFISKTDSLRMTYKDIKSNPESKQISTVMGKKASKYNITFLITVALSVLSAYYMVQLFSSGGILLGILLLGCAIGLGLWSINVAILAFVATIFQLRLNKKPIGYINLAFSIIIVLAVVVGIALLTR